MINKLPREKVPKLKGEWDPHISCQGVVINETLVFILSEVSGMREKA